MFKTEPTLSEYQLYLEAKKRREAKEAEAAAAAVKAKAAAKAAQATLPSQAPTQQTPTASQTTSENAPTAGSTTKLVVYPFPVRPNVFAELKLPADLTVDEASRLCAFLKAISLSDGDGGSQ